MFVCAGYGLFQAPCERRCGSRRRDSVRLRTAQTQGEGERGGTQRAQEHAVTPQDAGIHPPEDRSRRSGEICNQTNKQEKKGNKNEEEEKCSKMKQNAQKKMEEKKTKKKK